MSFRQRVVVTSGDKDRRTELSVLGGDYGGAFVRQLEAALLQGEIDIAVHSLKDLPTQQPDGLALEGCPLRVDPRDALCGARCDQLPSGARVGTGAPRRRAQLLRLRPDLEIIPIRGNVPPRLAKMRSARLDSVVLAMAGLERLGLLDEVAEVLGVEEFPPSPGQGALGIQIRADDELAREVIAAIEDKATTAAVRAERSLLHALHGGCSVPIGAIGLIIGTKLMLQARVTSLDGTDSVAGSIGGSPSDATELGTRLAQGLRDDGAMTILDEVPSTSATQI